jgi:6-pyruvoyl-tetrahydropterin synthase
LRKKAHICLAGYIVESLDDTYLNDHRRAFQIGNILPDVKPSFLYKRHEFYGTFEEIKERIWQLTSEDLSMNERVYCRRLGEVIHYVADYFTTPHNNFFTGGFKEHCRYEKQLNVSLKQYIESDQAKQDNDQIQNLTSAQAVISFIERMHAQYEQVKKNIELECHYIVALCCQVAGAMLRLLHINMDQETQLKLAA